MYPHPYENYNQRMEEFLAFKKELDNRIPPYSSADWAERQQQELNKEFPDLRGQFGV